MEDGFTQDEIFEFTKIDPWFLAQLVRPLCISCSIDVVLSVGRRSCNVLPWQAQ